MQLVPFFGTNDPVIGAQARAFADAAVPLKAKFPALEHPADSIDALRQRVVDFENADSDQNMLAGSSGRDGKHRRFDRPRARDPEKARRDHAQQIREQSGEAGGVVDGEQYPAALGDGEGVAECEARTDGSEANRRAAGTGDGLTQRRVMHFAR